MKDNLMVSEDTDIFRPEPKPEDEALIQAYAQVGVPVDRLPYTTDFDRIAAPYAEALGIELSDETRNMAFVRLANLRKAGHLLRLVSRHADDSVSADF
jgi:hypothetical protein